MVMAVSIYGLMLLLRTSMPPAIVVATEGVAIVVLLAGAWCGGHLVFGHGVGVGRKTC
jgi:hypothetical protein